MAGSRRVWAARSAAVLAGAAIVVSSTVSSASTAAEPRPARSAAAPAVQVRAGESVGSSQTLRVTIPEVMVGARSTTSHGALEVPVLIAAGVSPGRVYVDAPTSGCSWRLVPGEVTWVHCEAVARNQVRTLVVVLDDGRTLARRV